MPVRFDPSTAGSVEGNLALGIVPELRFDALPAVKPPDVPVMLSDVLTRLVPATVGTELKLTVFPL